MSQQPPDPGAPDSSPAGPPQPQPPYNPYAQPPGPEPTQPVWQGHQAPQQAGPGAAGQPPGGRRRRTWLIVLAAILFLTIVGGAITAAVLVADDEDSNVSVADIEPGDCLASDELAETGGSVDTIEKVDCSDEHDAEVFATIELGADDDTADAASNCVDELDGLGQTWSALNAAGLEVRPLVEGEEEGDKVVCFVRHTDGEPLTGSEFE